MPNSKNLSANFRELAYDPGNRYCIPNTWGTTRLIAQGDLITEPVARWADLWNPRYAGKVGIWTDEPREVISLTLKSLDYSANSENPTELEQALERLLKLQTRVRSMALTHEKLYQSDSLAKIDFGEYIKSLVADFFRSYQRGLGKAQLVIEADNIDLELDQAVPAG